MPIYRNFCHISPRDLAEEVGISLKLDQTPAAKVVSLLEIRIVLTLGRRHIYRREFSFLSILHTVYFLTAASLETCIKLDLGYGPTSARIAVSLLSSTVLARFLFLSGLNLSSPVGSQSGQPYYLTGDKDCVRIRLVAAQLILRAQRHTRKAGQIYSLFYAVLLVQTVHLAREAEMKTKRFFFSLRLQNINARQGGRLQKRERLKLIMKAH